MATGRTTERVLAALGKLSEVELRFERCDDVPLGGVLCALPALLAVGLLHARILVPEARWSFGPMAADYEGLRDQVARLCRLQVPAQAGRISAAP